MATTPIYKATLTAQGKDYIGKGDTAFEAIDNIPLKYYELKDKGKITLKKGKLSSEVLFFLPRLRLLLKSPPTAKLWAKNLEELLG